MQGRTPIFAEPELRRSPPRPVRLTAAGWLEIALTAGPVAALVGLNAALFFGRPRPAAVEIGFAVLLLAAAGFLWRIAALWLGRFELLREGAPAAGVIVEKRPLGLGWSRYRAWYAFGGEERSAEGFAPSDRAEIGDAATVLRLGGAAGERAVIHRLCGCVAEADDAASDAEAQSPLTPRI